MIILLSAMMLLGGPKAHRAVDAAPIIYQESLAAGVDPYLVASLAWVETRWNPRIRSKTNDCGMMQLNLKFSKFTCHQLFDLRTNVRAGIKAIKYWQKRFGKDFLCHYNSGNKCYRRSRNYAKKIRRTMRKLRRMQW